ncbi:glycosyltransferase [Paracoccaceae bacterium Fryx2]|nr:glycosyltransferase [Paracoccaceae bacterium Fryx2]
MKVLFVHQNFPGQFLHLAPELQRRGHQCLALTDSGNNRPSPIPVMRYRHAAAPPDPAATRLGRNFTQMSDRGVTVARACLQLREQKGFVPDVIFGHSGWGETLFLKEVWPEAKLLVYAEFYYSGRGRDVGFDPEFDRPGFDGVMLAQGRAAHLGQAMLHADAGLSPTHWQADTYPSALRGRITVIHDGVDTAVMVPDPQAAVTLPTGQVLRAGDEVLTFVNRNLEPYRGYHTFMRALPGVMAARPQAQVVIVGGDEVSYGRAAPEGTSWKEIFLAEVRDRVDLSRVHFLGKVPYPTFVSLMQISRVHAYLTYPFVLSWSMLEAMAAGALVVGSRTAPVQELITDGVNGLLVDFFDVPGWTRALVTALAEPDRFLPLRAAARQSIVARYDLRSHCLPRMVEFVESWGPDAVTGPAGAGKAKGAL